MTPVQLTNLIDAQELTARLGDSVPCRENDAEIWFADTPVGVEFAKTLCGTCPIKDSCLTGALERQEPWGVWGGELLLSGRIVTNKRPCGRPPKVPRPELVIDELGIVGSVA